VTGRTRHDACSVVAGVGGVAIQAGGVGAVGVVFEKVARLAERVALGLDVPPIVVTCPGLAGGPLSTGDCVHDGRGDCGKQDTHGNDHQGAQPSGHLVVHGRTP